MISNMPDDENELTDSLVKKRRENVVRLYRSGLTPQVIASKIGISLSTANKDIHTYLHEISQKNSVSLVLTKVAEIDRYCYVEEVLQPAVDDGNFKAIQLKLNIMRAKHELMGLHDMKEEVIEDFPEDLDWQEDTEVSNPLVSSLKVEELSNEDLTAKYFEMMKQGS